MTKEEIKILLEDQKEIFGDLLFEKIDFEPTVSNQPSEVSEPTIEYKQTTDEMPKEKKVHVDQKDLSGCNSLDSLYKEIHTCMNCELGNTRNKFVFGVGNPNADLLLIGEAPGKDEDLKGEPFVGRAGKLLTDILKAINFERDEIYIANILKCRPPKNRDPLQSEMDQCLGYLKKQIALIEPKVILCLGRISANGILNKKEALAKIRGNVYEFEGVKVMATYHPAALLRNPNWKKGCWEDVQKVRELYDELTVNKDV